MNLDHLKSLFTDVGCKKLYAKPLAENDNSKNQVYFGPDFEVLNLFPNEGISPDSSTKNPIFKAKLRFGWLLESGGVTEAPSAQLILYPQYPEVRFSGFLKGCSGAPSSLMAGRASGRILFLGVTTDRRIVGFVVGSDSSIASQYRSLSMQPSVGVFVELGLPQVAHEPDSKTKLLDELKRIHLLGWIDSKQLSEDGLLKPCNASQCGGFTLEAELGIPKNSKSEPDFLGWEVKQHAVSNFDRVQVGVITLMTPEPNGGFYAKSGVESFVRKFGYADKMGRKDRMNFGGIYRVGLRHSQTKLTLRLVGFDIGEGKIKNPDGAVALMTDKDSVAASWDFSRLLTHWTRKHAKAAYVPSLSRTDSQRQYAYGNKVRLAVQTDFLRFLKAMANGSVYYDPAIKLENVSSNPRSKRRSQFRVASRNIDALYGAVDLVNLTA